MLRSTSPQPSTDPINSIDSQLKAPFQIAEGESQQSIANRLTPHYLQLLKSKIIEHKGDTNIVMPIVFPPSVQDAFKSQRIDYLIEATESFVAFDITMCFGPSNCLINTSSSCALTIPVSKIPFIRSCFLAGNDAAIPLEKNQKLHYRYPLTQLIPELETYSPRIAFQDTQTRDLFVVSTNDATSRKQLRIRPANNSLMEREISVNNVERGGSYFELTLALDSGYKKLVHNPKDNVDMKKMSYIEQTNGQKHDLTEIPIAQFLAAEARAVYNPAAQYSSAASLSKGYAAPAKQLEQTASDSSKQEVASLDNKRS